MSTFRTPPPPENRLCFLLRLVETSLAMRLAQAPMYHSLPVRYRIFNPFLANEVTSTVRFWIVTGAADYSGIAIWIFICNESLADVLLIDQELAYFGHHLWPVMANVILFLLLH